MKKYLLMGAVLLSVSNGAYSSKTSKVFSGEVINDTSIKVNNEECISAIKTSMGTTQSLKELSHQSHIARINGNNEYAHQLTQKSINIKRRNLQLHKWKNLLLIDKSDCFKSEFGDFVSGGDAL
jgi:hypothetical protein